MEKGLLLKYVQGNCSEEEKIAVASWIDDSQDNLKEYMYVRKIYDITSWQDKPAGSLKLKYSKEENRILKSVVRFSKYAAAFLLMALLVYSSDKFNFFSDDLQDEVVLFSSSAPKGEKSTVLLPDGTKVWLNSGSTITYSGNYNNKRTVCLEGEAFFDVARVEDAPFTVNAGHMDIEVLGTRFNVYAYPGKESVVATLEEGKIISSIKQINKKIELLPGQQVEYNIKNKISEIETVNTDLYTSWKNNKLRFKDARFADVIKKMERWYDVDIELDKDVSIDKLYTLTIETESLNEMLSLLSRITPINYRINDNKIRITKVK